VASQNPLDMVPVRLITRMRTMTSVNQPIIVMSNFIYRKPLLQVLTIVLISADIGYGKNRLGPFKNRAGSYIV